MKQTETHTDRKVTRIKVGAEDSVRVTVGNYGAIITRDLLYELGYLKECTTCFNNCLTSLYSCVIEKTQEEKESIKIYRDAINTLECLESLRSSLAVVCKQSYYAKGAAVHDGNLIGSGEPDEDTKPENDEESDDD